MLGQADPVKSKSCVCEIVRQEKKFVLFRCCIQIAKVIATECDDYLMKMEKASSWNHWQSKIKK